MNDGAAAHELGALDLAAISQSVGQSGALLCTREQMVEAPEQPREGYQSGADQN